MLPFRVLICPYYPKGIQRHQEGYFYLWRLPLRMVSVQTTVWRLFKTKLLFQGQ